MTTVDTIALGTCGCGRIASEPHTCEMRRGPLRVCECGEWTYAQVCGNPCRQPEPPPMGPGARTIPWRPCRHGEPCTCGES